MTNAGFITNRRQSGVTLIELMVSFGLMAILMLMVSTVFYRASDSFRIARASVQIHQNARAALNIMLRDFAAAKLATYNGDHSGYFAMSRIKDAESDTVVPAITFTTLADQPGAKPMVAGISPQVVIVRYLLQFAGGTPYKDPDTGNERPVYHLIKQVRYPQLAYSYVDMNQFTKENAAGVLIPDEVVTTDWLALNVLDMNVRVLYGGTHGSDEDSYYMIKDYGLCSDNGDPLTDSPPKWTSGEFAIDPDTVRLLGGEGAKQFRDISDNSTNTISVSSSWSPAPEINTSYRVEDYIQREAAPVWIELPSVVPTTTKYPMIAIDRDPADPFLNSTLHMPYAVEITLELTDGKRIRYHAFTQRFFVPASGVE